MDGNRDDRVEGKISRREFLIGAAGLAATTVVGGWPVCAVPPPPAPAAQPPAAARGTRRRRQGGRTGRSHELGWVYEENLKKIFFDLFERNRNQGVPISPMDLGKLRAGAKAGKVEMDISTEAMYWSARVTKAS